MQIEHTVNWVFDGLCLFRAASARWIIVVIIAILIAISYHIHCIFSYRRVHCKGIAWTQYFGESRMKFPKEFGFYGILTDPVVGYERLAAIMVERRVRFIQLRIKNRPADEILDIATSLRSIIPATSLFIINDHPDIAKEVGADGVHLGQDDVSLGKAREILGPNAIIGLSTHNPDQTRAACALSPDYIGVGPVFPTPTKAVPDPCIGLDGLEKMLRLATVPAVAIGGIDHSNVFSVLEAGAKNLCAVRCINRSTEPAQDLDRMIRAIELGAQIQS
jgi:thiamine-phosphate pyrophosphorylase